MIQITGQGCTPASWQGATSEKNLFSIDDTTREGVIHKYYK